MPPILVTGYANPDLDGTACAVAYAEYLRATGTPATAGVFGTSHREAQFVFSFFNIDKPAAAEDLVKDDPDIILVDASDLRGISDKLTPTRVIEIIDHRLLHEAEKFPNAKVQIELVGSAATLIAEKFLTSKTIISTSSAALLYSAIISNTVNFQANVTTDRDREMAAYLVTKIEIPSNYIHQMFAAKSRIERPLKDVFADEFDSSSYGGHALGIAQLEIVNVNKFVSQNMVEIVRALSELKSEQGLEYIFLTTIDLEEATNSFVVIDDSTQALLEHTLGISFKDGVAVKQGIMMRKTIAPLIKDVLSV